MVESLHALVRLEFLPRARVNLSADPADIEDLLDLRQEVRFDADSSDMIVPAWMLAERSQPQVAFFRRPLTSTDQSLQQAFHGAGDVLMFSSSTSPPLWEEALWTRAAQ